jgi:hypothetical protein
MPYEFSIEKQIGEKGFFLHLAAEVHSAQDSVEVVGVNDPIYLNAMVFAINYLFERRSELSGRGYQIEVVDFQSIPFDTGMLCVVLGVIDVLCQHFGIASEDVMYLDDRGNFCFPA